MTKTPPVLNLVHESETQRQHTRVRVPGILELDGQQGQQARFRLQDLSAGGIGFDARNVAFKPGQVCSGRLSLTLHPIEATLPVRFRIRHCDPSNGRTGASFEELNQAQVATIRRIVSAYLGGEVVGIGDVMHTLGRNNFTRPRADGSAPPARGFLAAVRTAIVTAAMLVVGGAALIYSGQRISEKMFSNTATAARVGAPQYEISMPRDGIFRSLVPADRIVAKGAPIGTFETSMLDLVRSQALKAQLGSKELEALLDRSIKGTITSPCDCRVQAMYVADEQYVGKGQPVVALQPVDFSPYVLARFPYPGADQIAVGSPVSVHISGEAFARRGRVAQLRTGADPDAFEDSVVVVVETEEPIARELVSHPVKVSVDRGDLRPLQGLTNVAQAAPRDAPASAPAPAPSRTEENVEAAK
ncbi:MAG: PilZ domain-containing protein [Sinimarinibacterium sp.]|jgi:alginate biosynthesis protein Alg44